MNYHLQKLIELGLIEKADTGYQLTAEGKDYTNLLDEKGAIVERQPKTSVLLHVVRKVEGKIELLASRRMKQPYLGKIGRLSGKVRFGETLEQAARRELYEETGLTAKEFVLEEVFHKLRHDSNGIFVQDVLFYKVFIREPKGTLIEKTPFQENFWLSKEQYEKDTSLDFFDTFEWIERYEPKQLVFLEDVGEEEGF